MRICSPQLGISPRSGLGGEVYDREILKRLARLGVEVEILLPKGMPAETVPGWQIHRTPRHRFNYYEYNRLFHKELFRLSQEPGFHLLRVHSPTVGPLGWWYKKRTGRPVVAHYHHLENDRLVKWMGRLITGSYDRITTDSQFTKAQLLGDFHLPAGRVCVVYPGVDEKYRPEPGDPALAARLGVTGRQAIFYLGSLAPRKNLRFLLEVFSRVIRAEPGARLVLGGSGPQAGELKGYAQRLGLAGLVIFPGTIPEEEKVKFYNLGEIFVLPSLLEGFGLAAAEAMACGKPVLASNLASLPEVVQDGITGFLSDPRNVDDFAGKLVQLLQDDPLRRQMGQAGRQRVLRLFSWGAAAQQTKEIYTEVLQMENYEFLSS